jgi:hypothetical protein
MIFLGKHEHDRFLVRERLAFMRGDERQVGRFAVALKCAGDLGIGRSKLRRNDHDAERYCEKESWKRFHVSLISMETHCAAGEYLCQPFTEVTASAVPL